MESFGCHLAMVIIDANLVIANINSGEETLQ